MPQNRWRHSIVDESGTVVAELEPPPTVVKLVEETGSWSIWANWFERSYQYMGALTNQDGVIQAIQLTTAERDALTAVNGMIIYNTTTNAFNFYENGAWVTK